MHYNSITVSLSNSITDENESQEDSTFFGPGKLHSSWSLMILFIVLLQDEVSFTEF